MAFLSPLFMLGAAAAAIPIMLHLFHRETEARVKFSSVSMLRRGPVEESNRRHLRQLLLLALRVAALVLLAFAFARPFFTSRPAGRTGLRVVAVDTSLSLSAPGQFERARQLAKDAINGAPQEEAVAVVTFANAAQVVAPPGGDRSVALAAVDAAAAAFGATDYRAALDTVSEVLNAYGAERATVVVVTDLQESGWGAGDRGSLPESAHVEIADVGAPPANLAVTNAQRDGDRVVATIRNTDQRARDARVHLLVDGRQVAEATAAVGANQSAEVALTGALGATAAISVDDPGGIQGDNTRFLVLNNAGRPSLLLITTSGDLPHEAFYVEQALVAQGASPSYRAEGMAASALGTQDSHRLEEAAGVVLLSTRGLDQRGRDLLASYLTDGGSVLAAMSDDVDGEALAEVLGPASFRLLAHADARSKSAARTLAPTDTRHPVFQAFGVQAAAIGLVKFTRFAKISGTGCQTLATFTTGEPALLDCTLGNGRALVFASDFGNQWNDFPLHATFVPFLHEAVKYLAGGHPAQGEYLVGEEPAGVPSRPGIATVPDRSGRAIRSIAVNVDPNESDPRRLTPEEFQAAVSRLKDVSRAQAPVEAQEQEDCQRLWRYVLTLMVAVLMVESVLARRT